MISLLPLLVEHSRRSPSYWGLGWEGMAVAATLWEAMKRAPYRWSPLCLSLQSKAEPWVCQCAFSRSVVACSRYPKSGYSYWGYNREAAWTRTVQTYMMTTGACTSTGCSIKLCERLVERWEGEKKARKEKEKEKKWYLLSFSSQLRGSENENC